MEKVTEMFQKEIPQEIEIEGGGSTWWYVCPECHGAVDPQDHYCRHCGQAITKKETGEKRKTWYSFHAVRHLQGDETRIEKLATILGGIGESMIELSKMQKKIDYENIYINAQEAEKGKKMYVKVTYRGEGETENED